MDVLCVLLNSFLFGSRWKSASYGPEIKIHIIRFHVFTHTAEATKWDTLQYIGLVDLAIKKRPPVHSKARLQNEDLKLKSLPFPGESSDLPKAGPHGR